MADVSRVSVELRMNGCSARRVGRFAAGDERGADDVRAGRELDAWMRPRSSMTSPAFVMFDEVGLEVGFAAHAERVHARAVHSVLDLVLVLEAARHAQVRAEHLHGELILGVERQRDLRENAADRADRLAFDVRVLRRVLTDAENVCAAMPMSGSPMASALTLFAASMNRSSSTGDMPSTSPTLSKPYAESSGGSSVEDRRRARADRGPRSRTRRGSAGAAPAGRDSASRRRRDRATS